MKHRILAYNVHAVKQIPYVSCIIVVYHEVLRKRMRVINFKSALI